MASDKSPLGSVEDRLVRIPQELRANLGLETGRFLSLPDKNGGYINLQIVRAYQEDRKKNSMSAYISKSTYDLLEISKIMLSGIKPVDDILIGCDPEFFLINANTKNIISASHFFPHYGDVGSDVGLAEVRPRPALKEKELSNNIHMLLKEAHNHINNRISHRKQPIKMVAASCINGSAAGFHIHFGLPAHLLLRQVDPTRNFMIDVLDYYIGISSILPEGSEDFRRRSAFYGRYGKPGDHRHDLLTLEYRVPGGHLLRHPVLSSGLIAISIVVMKDLLSRMKMYSDNFERPDMFREYNDLRNMYPRLPDKEKIYAAITSPNINAASEYADEILEDLIRMTGFDENRYAIADYFSYFVDISNGKNRYNSDIETNWRLRENEGQQRQMAVL